MSELDHTVVVGVQHRPVGSGWQLTPTSAEVLRSAQTLTNGPVVAVSELSEPDLSALAELGVSRVYRSSPRLDQGQETGPEQSQGRTAAVSADLLADVVNTLDEAGQRPACVLVPSSYWGKEVTGRLAALLGGAGVVDAAEISVAGGPTSSASLVVDKSVLSGAWHTRAALDLTAEIPVVALSGRPAAATTGDAAGGAGLTAGGLADAGLALPELVDVPLTVRPESLAVRVLEATPDAGSGAASLTDAEVVVVGGRGVDGDFDLVSDLADALGGAVGATRVACDEGWIDRSAQVGQTGVVVQPKLYVGLGVSGAVHHTCGIQGSQVIVAVCDDPDAPIFEIADFGVVGDVAEVVPAALERLRELQNA